MDGTTPLLHFSAGHTQVKCLFMWYDCLPSRVWGTCSQCTTESDSQRSTFQSSLCRPHRAIWDPHKGDEFILGNLGDWEGRRPNAGSPLAPNDACHFKFPENIRGPFLWDRGINFSETTLRSLLLFVHSSLKRSSNCLKPKPLWELARILAGQKSTPTREPQAPRVAGFHRISNSKHNYIGHLESWIVEQSRVTDTSKSWQCAGCMSMGRASDRGAKSIPLRALPRHWHEHCVSGETCAAPTLSISQGPGFRSRSCCKMLTLNRQHNAAWKRLVPGGQKRETRELGICNTTASKLELQKNKQE